MSKVEVEKSKNDKEGENDDFASDFDSGEENDNITSIMPKVGQMTLTKKGTLRST